MQASTFVQAPARGLSHNFTLSSNYHVLNRTPKILSWFERIIPILSSHVSLLPSPVIWTACLLLIPLLTYIAKTVTFLAAHETKTHPRFVPEVPYYIPFAGHACSLALSPGRFIARTIKTYGWKLPLAISAGTLKFIAITNPEHIQTIFKSSKQLTSKPATVFAHKYLLGAPRSVIPFYEADDSGMGSRPRKGSRTKQENRIHFHQARATQKFLSGQHLHPLADRYLKTLTRNLHSALEKISSNEWLEHSDFYSFLQVHVSRAAIETLMGSKILELNPSIVEEFWKFDRNVPLFLRCLPRWIIPDAYRSRDRLLASIKRWHAYAHEHFDCAKVEKEDPEWDSYFGSKLIRARQEYSLKMTPMTADARASEDIGLMFAANANILPTIFWYIFEALRDSDLRERMLSEVRLCIESGEIDITKLCTQPLLQSAHAEVLRLRVAIAMSRVSELEDFDLHDFRIKKDQTLMIFSRPPALNEEAWAAAGRQPTVPLSQFHSERFLVQRKVSPRQENPNAREEDGKQSQGTEFSLDGLAGLWLPYGGGQRMCPGRHFAKAEVLSTFALLFSQFEIELNPSVNSHEVLPDLRWVPAGALPPASKVPFRIRRKATGAVDCTD